MAGVGGTVPAFAPRLALAWFALLIPLAAAAFFYLKSDPPWNISLHFLLADDLAPWGWPACF